MAYFAFRSRVFVFESFSFIYVKALFINKILKHNLNIRLMETATNSRENRTDSQLKQISIKSSANLNIADVKREFSESIVSNTIINEIDYYSVYKSTDFYSKDIDEKIEAPIELKNFELNNKTNTSQISKIKRVNYTFL